MLFRFIAPIISLYRLTFSPSCFVQAFHNPIIATNHHPQGAAFLQVRKKSFHSLFSSADDDDDDTNKNNDIPPNNNTALLFDNIQEAASVKLVWEKLEEASSRPVLDLSSRDASPEDSSTTGDKIIVDDEEKSSWTSGQKWQETKLALVQLGIIKDDDDDNETALMFLDQCPQLYRLDTEMIVETAEWILQEFGSDYFAKQPTSPKLLSYRLVDVQYGIEFMSTMMMNNDAKPFCQGSADFFQTAIDGGIQEQSVSNALGAASAATYQANQKVAGDAMSSLQSLKNRKTKGL